jgi:hypothetical protein
MGRLKKVGFVFLEKIGGMSIVCASGGASSRCLVFDKKKEPEGSQYYLA